MECAYATVRPAPLNDLPRTLLIPDCPDDIDAAVATLRRGTRFLGDGLLCFGKDMTGIAGEAHRAKVIGNGLREVDRFLNVLIDAVVAAAMLPPWPGLAFHRRRNTAHKLLILRTAMMLPNPDDAALRAIGRSRDRLFHRAGTVCSAGPPIHVSTVRADYPSGSDMRAIASLYDRVADDLVIALAQSPAGV